MQIATASTCDRLTPVVRPECPAERLDGRVGRTGKDGIARSTCRVGDAHQRSRDERSWRRWTYVRGEQAVWRVRPSRRRRESRKLRMRTPADCGWQDDQQFLSSTFAPPLPPKPGFNSSRFEEHSGSSDGHSVTSRDGRYLPSSSSSSQHRGGNSLAPPRLPTRPSFNRQEITNPFEEADPSDNEGAAPRTQYLRPALPSRGHSATSDYGSYSGYSSGTDPLSDDGYMSRGPALLPSDGSGTIVAKKPWATFDEHPSRQMYPVGQISQSGKRTDPWSASGWSATTSPTSSRGTHTNAIEPEDPFAE